MNSTTSSISTTSTFTTYGNEYLLPTNTPFRWRHMGRQDACGFASKEQFKTALKLAGQFGHLWANQIKDTKRIVLPNGAVKIEEFYRDPHNQIEANDRAQAYINDMKKRHGYCPAQHGTPTPIWESNTRTFKVRVYWDGSAQVVHYGIIGRNFDPNGNLISWGLTPDWTSHWCGRAESLAQAVYFCHYMYHWGFGGKGSIHPQNMVELLESSPVFWKTGLQAGSRWYQHDFRGDNY